jgi:SulP family sulfate permease
VVIVLFPRLSRAVPAPLVAVVVITTITLTCGLAVPTVGDEGALPTGLPQLFLPAVPLTLGTLRIIGPFALGAALVGLVESLMTAKLVDDITETGSDKTRESVGQGIAQITSALFGGMGGCGVIGQTMINVRESGARTRIFVIDLAGSHISDASTVAALDVITTRYRRHGKTVEIRGMNDASSRFHGRLTGNLAGADG